MNPTAKPAGHNHRPAKPTDFVNEPITDFAEESKRTAMLAGLKAVEAQFGRKYPLVIGGKRIDTAEHIVSVNPSRTSQVIGHCPKASKEQAKLAVDTAHKAFESWREVEPRERAAYLKKAADVVRSRQFEFAAWITSEAGKSWREADMEVGECIDFLEYYAKEMVRLADCIAGS